MYDEQELDKRPFFQIIHAMIREDATEEEQERTHHVMEWVHKSRYTLERVSLPEEKRLFGELVAYYHQYGSTPTRDICTQIVTSKQRPKAILDLLDDYDKQADQLKSLSHLDLDMQLDLRKRDFEVRRLVTILANAKMITMGAVDNPKGKDHPQLSGTRDALTYIMEWSSKVLMSDEPTVTADTLAEQMIAKYAATAEDERTGRRVIKTGISAIDELLGGLRRGELNGVLGYTGQRKSATTRTIAYNAARAGHRVLYIPLESSVGEELTAQWVMHAHVLDPHCTVSTNKVLDARLSRDEERALFNEVGPDFGQTAGRNLIIADVGRDRTWENIKRAIERETNSDYPVDLVVIDYLTLVTLPSGWEAKERMVSIIQDAKQLALNAGSGRGVSIVTPIQGSRKGYEEATAQDGAWETTGIFMHSELDKSLDNCFYVYTNDEISAGGAVKVGSCKARRGANIPATFVDINPTSGFVGAAKPTARGDRNAPLPSSSNPLAYFDYMEV
ncbi:hypothetical protein JAO29_18940 [Edaphobacter sp. HDX4]|uniref:DnaB-like helicase C-terminal domain-containing protein n=1 Tax=Edaphobacter sp. HDX4 TaxID=2794064 RepID=UPI002FE59CCA